MSSGQILLRKFKKKIFGFSKTFWILDKGLQPSITWSSHLAVMKGNYKTAALDLVG